jgi:formylglycine-generating enzyme required for sulfatase activity
MRLSSGSTAQVRPSSVRVLAGLAAIVVAVGAALMPVPYGLTAASDGNGAVPEFVEIPGGPFVMGADKASDPDAFDNERWSSSEGQGTVDLPAFMMSRHEITVEQFTAFARSGAWMIGPQALSGPSTHPVRFVSWPEALAYARWLQSTLERSPGSDEVRQRLAQGWRVALPTEAQWEKGARGTDARRFPWGNEPRPGRANFEGTGPTPVGQFSCPECPYGLQDMSGNVWEWTRSPYEPYPYSETDDYANLGGDALFVIRGGHFGDAARLVRTSTRTGADPGARRAFIGFRVVLSPPRP